MNFSAAGRFLTGAYCAIIGFFDALRSAEVRKTYWAALMTLTLVTWVLGALGIWGVTLVLPVNEVLTGWELFFRWALRVVASGLVLLTAVVLALPFAQLIAPKFCFAPFFAALGRDPARRDEIYLGGGGLSIAVSFIISVRRLRKFFLITGCALLVGWVPVVGPVLSATMQLLNSAWMMSSELLDPYFDARQLDFDAQTRLMNSFRWECLGFGVICAPLLALPIIGPLFFAGLQAAAARFVLDVLEVGSPSTH